MSFMIRSVLWIQSQWFGTKMLNRVRLEWKNKITNNIGNSEWAYMLIWIRNRDLRCSRDFTYGLLDRDRILLRSLILTVWKFPFIRQCLLHQLFTLVRELSHASNLDKVDLAIRHCACAMNLYSLYLFIYK